MAKQRGRPRGSKNRTTHAAETVGSALGSVMAKVDAWMAQREEIARELRTVADRIMGGENPFSRRITTPSMVADAVADTNAAKLRGERPVKRKRRKMSAEARAKISAAAKARWAKAKRGAKKAGGRGSEVGNG
jgi:hypothetical protein